MHRFINEEGIALIKQFEGFSAEAYTCAGGYLTIGYGHKLLPSDRYKSVTMAKADEILRKDLRKSERAVLKYITVPLTDDQFAALVSFTFNLGPASLQRSTLRQKLNYGEYRAAAKEFKRWVYAGGKRVMGLVRRRKVESELFLSNLMSTLPN